MLQMPSHYDMLPAAPQSNTLKKVLSENNILEKQ
jgi:hypothetical protein